MNTAKNKADLHRRNYELATEYTGILIKYLRRKQSFWSDRLKT
jgi:hypothetical protein